MQRWWLAGLPRCRGGARDRPTGAYRLLLTTATTLHLYTSTAAAATPGDTPLHVCETAACAQLLLDAGASLTCEDAKGKTPYHVAVEERRGEMVAFLAAAYAARGLALPHVDAGDAEDGDVCCCLGMVGGKKSKQPRSA